MLIVFTPASTWAQDADSLTQSTSGLLNVFLDCGSCNQIVIKTEIPYVNYVRDPGQADVHTIVTRQNTASGGSLYTYRFIGLGRFRKQDLDLTFTSPLSDSDIKRQNGIAKTLAMGLMPYVSQTNSSEVVDIKTKIKKKNTVNQEPDDPWDYWIFGTDLRGGFESEENNNSLNIEGSVDANRVTEDWRFRNSYEYQFREENFEDDGEKIKSNRRSWDISASLVKSLSSHMSAGVFGSLRANTYQNTRLGTSFNPGIEYNFYPWSEFSRRVITLGYYAGYKTFNYIDETIYGKTREGLLFHSVKLEADIRQPWGNFNGSLDVSHYPALDGRYRIRLFANLSLRVTEGLSLTFRVQAQSIHDQLYLAAGDATLEEILLKQRQLQTTYSYDSAIGIRYTFGSIYNNIVNIRM